MRRAKETGSLMPPKIILNAPTKMMKEQEYGAGYRYDHDEPDAFSGQNYFPEQMGREQYYNPPERGFEREVKKRLEYWSKLRKRAKIKKAGTSAAFLFCRGGLFAACVNAVRASACGGKPQEDEAEQDGSFAHVSRGRSPEARGP